jgi:predicted enzyme related to lactoylglutathione lyase
MTGKLSLQGITTISFFAADMKAARAWYSELLGVDPYFQRPDAANPAYIEFRIGDYQHELGIIDSKYAPKGAAGTGGAIVYWHVDDIEAAMATLKALGAQEHDPVTERGPGFITASVIDPFGNILGVMYNQHYMSVRDALKKP